MMLTKTLAFRRSRVTSTPAPGTMPVRRGSFTSSARNVATSSRMASATRSARRCAPPPCSLGMPVSSRGRRIEGARHFLGAVALDDVAALDVVEVLDADAAFEAFAHLAHVVLEALERREGAVEHLDAIAD